MTKYPKEPKQFPTFEAIMFENLKQKKEKALISEFIRLEISVPKFTQLKGLNKPKFMRLLRKYDIKADNIYHNYENICEILKEYHELKTVYRKYIAQKYEVSRKVICGWQKNFLIHKDKYGKVKLILINPDWDKYKDYLKEQERFKEMKLIQE